MATLADAFAGIADMLSSAFKPMTEALDKAATSLGAMPTAASATTSALSNIAGSILSFGQQLSTVVAGLAAFTARLSAASLKAAQALVTPLMKLTGLLLAPLTALLGVIASAIGSMLTFVAGILSSAFSAILESTLVQSVVIPSLAALASALGVALVPIAAIAAAIAAVAAVLLGVLAAALAAFAAAVLVAAAALAAPFVAAAAVLTTALTLLAAPFAAIGTAVAAATGPFIALGAAASAVTAPFQMLGNALGPFVSALNPAAMQAFNYALKGLQATIGVAFLPVIQVMTGAMRNFAGAILPLMQALAPILGDLASVLASAMLPIIQTVADTFLAMTPLIQFVVDILGAMGEGMQAFAVVLRTVIGVFMDFLAGLFGGGGLKTAAAQFSDAIRRMTTAVVVGIAQLAVAFGQLGFIDKIVKNLGAVIRPAQGAVPAPSNVGIKGFEQIGKDAAMAAFAAQGGGGAKEKDTNDWLKDIAEQLKAVKNQPTPEWATKLVDAVTKGKTTVDAFVKVIEKVFGSIDAFVQFARDHWPQLPEGAGKFASAVADAATHPGKAFEGFKRGVLHPFDTLGDILR